MTKEKHSVTIDRKMCDELRENIKDEGGSFSYALERMARLGLKSKKDKECRESQKKY